MSDQQRNAETDLAVCQAATPGPWSDECGEVFDMLPDLSSTFSLLAYSRSGDRRQESAILAFIALAREALPWWIAEAERLRAENAALAERYAPGGVWTGTVAQWWHLGPLLVQLVEVREVRFTDANPKQVDEDCFEWWVGHPLVDETSPAEADPSDMPSGWFEDTCSAAEYFTLAEALADASRRAIAWAKKEAAKQ